MKGEIEERGEERTGGRTREVLFAGGSIKVQ